MLLGSYVYNVLLGSYMHNGRTGGARVEFIDRSKSLVKRSTIEREGKKGTGGAKAGVSVENGRKA